MHRRDDVGKIYTLTNVASRYIFHLRVEHHLIQLLEGHIFQWFNFCFVNQIHFV